MLVTTPTVKKRLLITLTFPPDVGGMQSFAHQRCLRAGDETVVLAPWHIGCAAFDAAQPFPVLRWRPIAGNVSGLKRASQLLQPLRLAHKLLRTESFDAIECWQPLPLGLTAWLLKRAHWLPVIVWSHGSDLLRMQRAPGGRTVLRWTLSQADRLIVNSMATRAQVERLGPDPASVRVIHPPVDTRRFHPGVDASVVVARHQLQGKKVILTVARLVERKGIDIVIRAMPRIIESIPNVAYLVAGMGPELGKLEALVSKCGLEEKVIFTGYVPDAEVPCYYAACDVLVLVSRTLADKGEMEGFGMVYLEAGACGKPVIAGRGGGTAEAVEENVTGLLVDSLDPEDVAQAVIRLLTNRDLGQRMGMAGRQRALKEPPWEYLRLD